VFQYSFAEIQSQLDTLPTLLRLWFGWMGIVILFAPIAFVHRRRGRIVLAFTAVFAAAMLPVLHAVGISYLISLVHLVVWVPLLLYLSFLLRERRIRPGSPFGVWAIVAVSTLIVTLVLDVRDFVRWLGGERGLIDPAPGVYLPWVTIPAMIAAFAAVAWYILGPRLRSSGDSASSDPASA